MNEQNIRDFKKNSKSKAVIALLLSLCLLLICALGGGIWIYIRHRSNFEAAIDRLYDTVNEKQRIIEEEMISKDLFKEYAVRYGINTQFVQQFVDDAIVYKNETGIAYAPIDDTLKKTFVDTSLISTVNGRRIYNSTDIQAKTVVDVSRYQKSINWNSVAGDGVDGAMIRVGYRGYSQYGEINGDSYFSSNINGALNAGLDVGVYFFSQAITEEEAIEEAEYVISKIKDYDVTLPVVFDMEEIPDSDARANSLSSAKITDITIAFCERIAQAGYTPMVYGNTKWMCEKVEISRLEKYGKWIAQYNNRPYFPYEYEMWQYTETGTVNGIPGNADINLMFIK